MHQLRKLRYVETARKYWRILRARTPSACGSSWGMEAAMPFHFANDGFLCSDGAAQRNRVDTIRAQST
jgi:hypothetical protein